MIIKQLTNLQIKVTPVRVNTVEQLKGMIFGQPSEYISNGNILMYKHEKYIPNEQDIANALDFYMLDFNSIRYPNQINLRNTSDYQNWRFVLCPSFYHG